MGCVGASKQMFVSMNSGERGVSTSEEATARRRRLVVPEAPKVAGGQPAVRRDFFWGVEKDSACLLFRVCSR